MTAQTILKYTVDLNKGLQMTPLAPMLATEDDNAHTFVISAVKDGEPQRFTGADVRGFFIRPDGVTVPINGTVDEEGNATVTLTARCYAVAGRFQLAIRIVQGDVKSVIFCGDGSLRKVSTDAFIDEEGIIPSLDELLAQIATIEGAVNNAEAAADRANAAADKAENAKGETGATPNLTIGTVETLDAGSNATATITGTPEDPVLSLGIPKGYDGAGAVLSVNGKTGDVTLDAAAVGALASGGTANKAARIESDTLIVRSFGQWSGSIDASGTSGVVQITPTAVSGYTFVCPCGYSMGSHYIMLVAMIQAGAVVNVWMKNWAGSAVSSTMDFYGIYRKN